jgi:hypothetical protein
MQALAAAADSPKITGTVEARDLTFNLSNGISLVVRRHSPQSHCYEFSGVPTLDGVWSLPLDARYATTLMDKVPAEEATKELIISILSSRAWKW